LAGAKAGDLVTERPKIAERYRAKVGGRSPAELLKELSRLEDEMYKAASNLDFETAARLRDDVSDLKEAVMRTG